MGSSEPAVSRPSHFARLNLSAGEYCASTGRVFPFTTTSEPLLPIDLPQMVSSTVMWPTPRTTDTHAGRGAVRMGDGWYRPSPALRGANLADVVSTPSAVASPVRTSASRERARALKASAAAYGRSTPELLASFDRASSSWRTSQLCLDGGYHEFSETWPRSGIVVSGIVSLPAQLVLRTVETDSGS